MIDVDVVHGGEFGANALIYKPMSQSTSEYLHRHLDSALASIRNVSSNFVDSVKNLYNRFSSAEAINRAKMFLHSAGMHLAQDVIYPVRYDRYRDINLIMQSYVMAKPEVSELYRKNKCYGFQDTYIDPEPNCYGKDRFDYQRVMDGWIQYENDDDQLGYFMHYSNSDPQDELSTMDQIAVQSTWDVVARLIAEGIDPTHPDGESL